MKNVAIIIILFQGFQFISAQRSFAETKDFLVTTKPIETEPESLSYIVNLVSAEDQSKKISSLVVEDTELFEDIFITTLDDPGLEGVSEVIKLEVEYLACCAHVEAYYYLIKDDNSIVALPELTNVYCEGSDTDFQYTFPNQEYGIQGNILQTQTYYTEKANEVKYVNLKQSFVWNDGIIQNSNTSAITSY